MMNHINKQKVIYFPNSQNPRWLVRSDKIGEFWRILPRNGFRGKVKSVFVRIIFPKLRSLLPYVNSEMLGAHFLYLGVDDGKQTQLSIILKKNFLVIEKFCICKNSYVFISKEAEILKKISVSRTSNFPQFISFEQGKLKYYGAIQKVGFTPKIKNHRKKLIDALAHFYRHFPISRNDEGILTCMSHGDLNKWNMFIDKNNKLHIFDFETTREAPLGFDLATSYVNEFNYTYFLTVLREDFIILASQLDFYDFQIELQMQKILEMI